MDSPRMSTLRMSVKSTNDRSSTLGLKVAQTGFRVLSSVAPRVAAATAAHIFCRPRRHRRPEAEVEILARARPLSLRLGLDELPAWCWGDENAPTVLLAHGWEGRGSQLHSFVEPLLQRGFSVVTWDAPGHGNSNSRQSSLIEFTDALWAVGRQVGSVHGVIAHSMGCAAAAMAFGEGLPVARAAFVASPSNLAEYTHQFADLVGLPEAVRTRMVLGMERRYRVQFADLDVERFPLPDNVPLLVVHDQDDKEVPPKHGRLIADRWPSAELVLTEGLGHRRVLKDPAVVSRVVDWMGSAA
ncbi:MAG: pimeloyl-ACP methyl ester carboxylesterase [Pseudohongiellaceae bacterium]|jgi:pimeloyl-ACP methyl ester carboxylesterase